MHRDVIYKTNWLKTLLFTKSIYKIFNFNYISLKIINKSLKLIMNNIMCVCVKMHELHLLYIQSYNKWLNIWINYIM
jgi:hypothetical protein